MERMVLVQFLSTAAVMPKRTTVGAAGFDLCAAHSCKIPAGDRLLVPTDLALEIPQGFFGMIYARSGIALRNSIIVGAGVIDSDYRGPVGVLLFNMSRTEDFVINAGDRIAQLVFQKCFAPVIMPSLMLTPSARGSGGFGSTGVTQTPSCA